MRGAFRARSKPCSFSPERSRGSPLSALAPTAALGGCCVSPLSRPFVFGAAFHIPSVGLAIAGSSLVAALVDGVLAWPLVGFFATSIYLLVIAAQFTIADGKGRLGRRGGLDRAG